MLNKTAKFLVKGLKKKKELFFPKTVVALFSQQQKLTKKQNSVESRKVCRIDSTPKNKLGC